MLNKWYLKLLLCLIGFSLTKFLRPKWESLFKVLSRWCLEGFLFLLIIRINIVYLSGRNSRMKKWLNKISWVNYVISSEKKTIKIGFSLFTLCLWVSSVLRPSNFSSYGDMATSFYFSQELELYFEIGTIGFKKLLLYR